MIAELDGSTIRSQDELHDALTKALDLPANYGRNHNALWDCLTGWIDTPLTLIWNAYEQTYAAVGEYAAQTLDVLRKAEAEVPGFRVEVR